MKKIIVLPLFFSVLVVVFSCAKQNPSEPAAQETPVDTVTVTNTPTITQTPTMTDTATITHTPTITNTPTDTATSTQTYTGTSTFTLTLTPTVTNTSTSTQTPTITPLVFDNFEDGNLVAGYGMGGVNTWSYNTDSLSGGNSRVDRFQVNTDNHCAEYALNVTGVVKTDLGAGYGYVDITVTAYSSGTAPTDITGYDYITFYSGCSVVGASVKAINVSLLSASGDNISYSYTASSGCNYYNMPFSAFTVNSGTLAGVKAGLAKMIFRIFISDLPGNEFGFTYTLDDVDFRK